MRLTLQQTLTITNIVNRVAGAGSAVYLFGSRLDDQAKGGDVDLFIESDTALSLVQRAQIKMELESQLALPVDIVAKLRSAGATPFQSIAKFHATQLGM